MQKEKGGNIMKKWLVACLLIVIFILAIFSGFLIKSFINFSKNENNSNKSAVLADGNNSVDASFSEVAVSPNAMITYKESFGKCGHTVITSEIVPREIVNLKEDMVGEYYKDWNVDSFSSDNIILSRQSSGICSEHYILRESDGYISISCVNDIGEYIFKGLTDISVQYLTEEDLKGLEKGIEIVGKENLNKFLEDFE